MRVSFPRVRQKDPRRHFNSRVITTPPSPSPRFSSRGASNPSIRFAAVINRPRHSYVVSLSPLFNAYGYMTQSLCRLIQDCYLDRLTPALMNEFTRIDHVYKLFCNQANDRLRSKVFIPGPLLKTSQCLVAEWVDFVTIFNTISSQGVSPHFDHLTQLLTSLIENLDQVLGLLDIGALQSLISRYSVEQIKSLAISIRKELPTGNCEFNDQTFPRKIEALANEVAAIFRKSVPKFSMQTSELMRLRTSLNMTCTELMKVSSGVLIFRELVEVARFAIAQASREFDNVLEILRMPIGIRLQFDGE
jgi:hypothetical protein